jgi:CRISPR/Cas system CSM-associated protein Csm3 (group 7 of RAMP superfamily)
MKNKRILKRKYYAITIQLTSPLSVAGSSSVYTDSDVIRNGNGELFIPGTSLAGVFRNRLNQKKSESGMMGYSDGKDGRMSSLFISDLYFIKEDKLPMVSIRDGVRLTDGKTVDNKFDMEIIETGAEGILYFHYILREGEQESDYEKNIGKILHELQSGSIRIGANKNRGFGRVYINGIYERKFESGDVKEWIKFASYHKELKNYTSKKSYEEWKKEHEVISSDYIKITVPLTLTGGISIRKYSTEPGKADFEHVTCNGNPVIPGSSWMGAIRADAKNILEELGIQNKEKYINMWFGYVDEKCKEAKQSNVVVAESTIRESHRQLMTRNRINRFDAGTKSGALYTELTYFQGYTDLEFMVKKEKNGGHYAMIGILNLIISDIQKGYVPVGGQTAVGRGIFAADTDKEIIYSEPVDLQQCNQTLYEQLFQSDVRGEC